MEQFPNATLFGGPVNADGTPDLRKLHDIVQAGAGSGRSFYDTRQYYNNGYYNHVGWSNTSVGEIVMGVVMVVAIIFVIYWILAFIARLNYRMYYGVRRKRDLGAAMEDIGTILTGAISGGENWRNGHPSVRRMLQDDNEDNLETTIQVVEAIEKSTEAFE